MSFLPPPQLTELCSFAAIADKEARSDLMRGFIRDENDYTSNFTGALRRIINSNSHSGLTATSYLLAATEEQEIGADATIIIRHGNQIKIAVFEAKWPRFSNQGYPWDYAQTSTGLSHYSDQLDRQKKWQKNFAVFEMFYSEEQWGTNQPYLTPYGSSCVWRRTAQKFRNQRANPDSVWKQSELKQMLANPLRIEEILREFGLCKKGKPISAISAQAAVAEHGLPPRILSISTEHQDHGDR